MRAPAGSATGADCIDVCPPSTSLAPAELPAVSPVIRQFTEGPSQVPGCSAMPFMLVGCGSPRCQRPVVAGFAPGVSAQPPAASKVSLNSVVLADGWNKAVNVVSSFGVTISCVACPPSDQFTNS